MARYSNDMVAHVWAQMNKDSGDSNNGQFYFRGPRLYSYGSHFVAGFIDDKGRAWMNGDSYSPTTAKHMSYAWRAVSHRTSFRIPSLTGIVGALESLGDKSRAAFVKRELTAYLATHWRAFPADSEAGAILWAAVSPRGSWRAEYARRDAKAAKDSAINAKRAARLALAHAKEVAAIPLEMVRLRMIQTATNASDWSKERDLEAAVRFYRDAHKGSKPGPVRVALWERVKLAKELAARLGQFTGKRHAKARGAIATLRRIWAGDYGGAATPLNYALAERQALNAALVAHMPPALRNRAETRLEAVQADINRLEAEAAALAYAAMQADCDAWRAGERVERNRYALKDSEGGALLRAYGVELDGCRVVAGTLETSQGATVPLSHAVRAFGFVRSIREAGQAWEANGRSIRVGHFTIDRVEPSGNFVAGCHRINWQEVERLARELGVWDCPADALESAEAA